jgi:hypothetical protein
MVSISGPTTTDQTRLLGDEFDALQIANAAAPVTPVHFCRSQIDGAGLCDLDGAMAVQRLLSRVLQPDS